MAESKHPKIHVRQLSDRKIVHSVEFKIDGGSDPDYLQRQLERVMRGMLINMNTDAYFVDEDEVNKVIKQLREAKKA